MAQGSGDPLGSAEKILSREEEMHQAPGQLSRNISFAPGVVFFTLLPKMPPQFFAFLGTLTPAAW